MHVPLHVGSSNVLTNILISWHPPQVCKAWRHIRRLRLTLYSDNLASLNEGSQRGLGTPMVAHELAHRRQLHAVVRCVGDGIEHASDGGFITVAICLAVITTHRSRVRPGSLCTCAQLGRRTC